MKKVKKRSSLRATYVYDLRYGGRGALPSLGFSLVIFILGCTWCLMAIPRSLTFYSLPTRIGVLDMWIFLFQGIRPLVGSGDAFQIPAIWITVQLFILYIVLFYPMRDLNGGGIQFLIRSGRRKSWWTSKLLWSYSIVLLYYLLLFVAVLLSAAASGGGFVNNDAVTLILGVETTIRPGSAAAVLLAPVLSSLAFASLELLISLIFSPVVAFLAALLLHVLTLFFATPVLFGSGSMVQRSAELGCGTVSFSVATGIIAAVCLGSWLLGRWVIEKKDILGSEEDRD